MKTTGVSGIPKFGLLDFLGHPNDDAMVMAMVVGILRTMQLILFADSNPLSCHQYLHRTLSQIKLDQNKQ